MLINCKFVDFGQVSFGLDKGFRVILTSHVWYVAVEC